MTPIATQTRVGPAIPRGRLPSIARAGPRSQRRVTRRPRPLAQLLAYGEAYERTPMHADPLPRGEDGPDLHGLRCLDTKRSEPPVVLTTARTPFGEEPELRLRSSSPLPTNPPYSAYPTFAMVKWAPVPRVAARLDTRRRAPGKQETAPDLRGCQIRAVVAQSGWRDLNPRLLDPQSSALPNCATARCRRPGADERGQPSVEIRSPSACLMAPVRPRVSARAP